ncbi:Uma2 family endonuclease [Spirosoma montaniterrae]|uniref:Restriction endonuclease n=1 Tax=Spirosoma montaniterrae TaxID=1178516 RepID=A0A1P9WY64_9BACT|nr:Uma2 family endonuclease [Spirosoma montaniterrae]AQG80327.1 restriction endonuclease [Spirosoma montaniterrae]
MITDLSQLDPNGTYTYADYLKWRFEQSVELIKGKIYNMSPAPRSAHQRIGMRLLHDLLNHFEERTCEVFVAPFDVRLPNPDYEPGFNNKVHTVVQPDICVICDPAKIDELGCVGPPDWVIEIASPSTQKKDFNEKFDLYESAGVREYWIVVPKSAEIYAYALRDGRYEETDVYEKGSRATSILFPDLSFEMDVIFNF